MDRASYFIKNKALFGSFPSQLAITELEQEGVRFFVDLTYSDEKKITPYKTEYKYISYPIKDRQIPTDSYNFVCFIVKIAEIINNLKPNELLYIHCKGGHGRSGIVVAVLLCYIFHLSPEHAIEYTTNYHSNREVMKEKWRNLGSPQTPYQKSFVYHCCKPINFYRAYRSGFTAGFSNFSPYAVSVVGLGTFHTAEAAIQAYKCPTDEEYVNRLQTIMSPVVAKNFGRKVLVRADWGSISSTLMYNILKAKFDQHPEIKKILMNTRLCPIIHHTRGDTYWGDGGDGTGFNILGNQLTKLRNYYYNQVNTDF
jgi:N-glycosidase YbiA